MLLLCSLRQRRWSSVSASLSRFTRSSRVLVIAASFLCPERVDALLTRCVSHQRQTAMAATSTSKRILPQNALPCQSVRAGSSAVESMAPTVSYGVAPECCRKVACHDLVASRWPRLPECPHLSLHLAPIFIPFHF